MDRFFDRLQRFHNAHPKLFWTLWFACFFLLVFGLAWLPTP